MSAHRMHAARRGASVISLVAAVVLFFNVTLSLAAPPSDDSGHGNSQSAPGHTKKQQTQQTDSTQSTDTSSSSTDTQTKSSTTKSSSTKSSSTKSSSTQTSTRSSQTRGGASSKSTSRSSTRKSSRNARAQAVEPGQPDFQMPAVGACHGAFTPGQLGGLAKSVVVDPPIGAPGSVKTITFTLTYDPDTARSGGSLYDCIFIGDKHGLIASDEDLSNHTSGTFTDSYTVGLPGTNAQIIVEAGVEVCDVAFFTGNDQTTGPGQKTPNPVCVTPFEAPSPSPSPSESPSPSPSESPSESPSPSPSESPSPPGTTPTPPPQSPTPSVLPTRIGGNQPNEVPPTVLARRVPTPGAAALPFTGADPGALIVLGGLLASSGGGMLIYSRRRRR
jgi:LPXTG-motif cell wall-anchored protein